MTSRAEAREVLDVHAAEFSKTGRLDAGTKKASDSREGPSWKLIRSYQASVKGSPFARGFTVSVQPKWRPSNDSSGGRGVKKPSSGRRQAPPSWAN